MDFAILIKANSTQRMCGKTVSVEFPKLLWLTDESRTFRQRSRNVPLKDCAKFQDLGFNKHLCFDFNQFVGGKVESVVS